MSMLYPSMDTLKEHIPNRYMLVNVVARRARQIADLAEQKKEPMDEKPVSLAVNEVAEGDMDIRTPDRYPEG